MLKVVGASWVKTRISLYILFGAALLALSAVFIADIERPQYDGTYCATAYWSHKSGFRVEFWGQQNNLANISKGVARICYKDTIFENGWAQIEIDTQAEYPDQIQAYAAGILEGALTWSNIYSHWSNTIQSYCEENDDQQLFCTWLREFLTKNYATVIDGVQNSKIQLDHYWHQVRLFYYQLEGIEFGFRKGVKRSRSDWEIPFEDFLIMNSGADLRDLKHYYDNIVLSPDQVKPNSKTLNLNDDVTSSMIFKILCKSNFVNLLFGHTSAGSYSTMLRMLKKYHFHYHFSTDSKSHLVHGVDMTFTGYPGIISSLDDFYLLRGENVKLMVAGVETKYKSINLWEKVDFNNIILLSARLMTANRLAHSGRQWARIMSRQPDTGSKQWIVIDSKRLRHARLVPYAPRTNLTEALPTEHAQTIASSIHDDDNSTEIRKLFKRDVVKPNKIQYQIKLPKGTIWIIDQVPGRLHGEDCTDKLLNKTYWYGNGIPYFEEIYNISGLDDAIVDNRDLDKTHSNLIDLDSVATFLRKRSYRGDIEGNKAYGHIDLKLYLARNTGENQFETVSGPLYHQTKHESVEVPSTNVAKLTDDQLFQDEDLERGSSAIIQDIRSFSPRVQQRVTPFKWSNSNLDADHFGQPDVFNFDKYTPKWAWKHNMR